MKPRELIKERGKPGMVVISDVDGVHTSPKDRVKIGAKPSDEFGTLFTLRNGVEVLELVSPDKKDREFSIAGFTGEDIIELYQFQTPDGQVIVSLLQKGIRTIIISGRNAAPVRDRFENKLRAETYLGVKDKFAFFQDLEPDLDYANVIFISDGYQDVPLLKAVSDAGGIAVATADCDNEVRDASDAQTVSNGGEGAFAELARAYLDFIQ